MVIPAALRARIESEMEKYPQPRGALLEALHRVHDELGYCAPEAAVELAEIFDMRPVEVMEVIGFYNMFFSAPQARHRAYVCTNLPCSLRGARNLLRRLEAHLEVDEHGNTSDGRLHIGHEECLGACAYAPMMRVDDAYHEDLDLEKAAAILDALE
jgi:NADH:ubiquinone oxidoreductase subunit E